jgi:fumarylacetoacetate (FAA) hydrolase
VPPVHKVASFRDSYCFVEHVRNARSKRGLDVAEEWYLNPVFYFSNHQTIVGHLADVEAPKIGKWLDYELEVGCVIGREGKDIPVDRAEEYIAGYTVINDWSLRDVQRQEMASGLGPCKGKDFATSMGPWLVTPDELEDRRSGKGYDLRMTAKVNGTTLSDNNWNTIHFSFAEMIARFSAGVTLYPGDVIGSGTTGRGCLLEIGPQPEVCKGEGGWLGAGDEVELEIERLGVLRNRIV